MSCAACGREIGAEPKLSVGEDAFHAACFTCGECQRELAGVSYYTIEGQRVCKDCYSDKFAPDCVVCHSKIIGQSTKLGDGRSFHPSCFTCGTCHGPIVSSFRTDESGLFHHTPNCETPVSATDTAGCKDCSRQLINVKFFTLDSGDKVCLECYEQNHSARCHICTKPILEGQSHVVKEWRFHKECFTCPLCEKHLAARKIKLHGADTVVCFNCSEPGSEA